MVGIGTAILTVAALGIGQPVFAPLAFAVFIIAIVWPLQAVLQVRLPRMVALLISIIVASILIGGFVELTTWAFSHVVRYAVAEVGQFQVLYAQIASWLEGWGIDVSSLWSDHFNVSWLLAAVQRITTTVNGMLSFSLVVLIYVIIGLLEVEPAIERLKRMTNQRVGHILLVGGARVAMRYRRYLAVRTVMSVVTGLLVWGFIALYGVPLALE